MQLRYTRFVPVIVASLVTLFSLFVVRELSFFFGDAFELTINVVVFLLMVFVFVYSLIRIFWID